MSSWQRLPRRSRLALDWIATLAAAIALVLAVKAWVINPYRIPSSSMEPTLHCARPAFGCEAARSDRVLACRICFTIRSPRRQEIVVFHTPKRTSLPPPQGCGQGGTFVKRLIGLPGDTVHEDGDGYVSIDGRRLAEPYVSAIARQEDAAHRGRTWHVPANAYFFLGDNRSESCDSRTWGAAPRSSLIGNVVGTYWPPTRITPGVVEVGAALLALGALASWLRRRGG
jgi:signal peptidase I